MPIPDGLYEVAYYDGEQPSDAFERLLAVSRNGKLTGSDRYGGVFIGEIVADRENQAQVAISVSYEVPPFGELVTGFTGGHDGATARISGTFEFSYPQTRSVIIVEGKPAYVEINFLGSVPD